MTELEKELLSLLTEDLYGLWEIEIQLPVGRQRVRETIASVVAQELAEWFCNASERLTADINGFPPVSVQSAVRLPVITYVTATRRVSKTVTI